MTNSLQKQINQTLAGFSDKALVSENDYNKDFDYADFHVDRFAFLLDQLKNNYKENSRFLDIGSLFGNLMVGAKIIGYESCGLDLDKYVKETRVLCEELGLDNRSCDLADGKFPFDNDYFDVVIFSEVLEHLSFYPFRVFEEINRVLKPGGKLIVTTPNLIRLNNVFKMILGKSINWDIREEYWDGVHFREYTEGEIIFLGKKAGLEKQSVDYRNFDYPNMSRAVKLVNKILAAVLKRRKGNLVVVFFKPESKELTTV